MSEVRMSNLMIRKITAQDYKQIKAIKEEVGINRSHFDNSLGVGKRLFEEGTIPASFSLVASKITPSGVIFASYKRAGDVKTGTVGD